MPSISIPLHTVMELTPKADGTMAETRFVVNVDKAMEDATGLLLTSTSAAADAVSEGAAGGDGAVSGGDGGAYGGRGGGRWRRGVVGAGAGWVAVSRGAEGRWSREES